MLAGELRCAAARSVPYFDAQFAKVVVFLDDAALYWRFGYADGFHNLSDVLAIAIALQCERLKQSDSESGIKSLRPLLQISAFLLSF